MNGKHLVKPLFYLAALYDGVLGAAFLVAAPDLYARFHVTPANHPGYVQFPALLLIVFALMFLAVARNPFANRNLIPYGILLKAAYCGVVATYWFGSGIPGMWKPFAVIDAAFLVLFVWAYRAVAARSAIIGETSAPRGRRPPRR
jgi:hypothetical protein